MLKYRWFFGGPGGCPMLHPRVSSIGLLEYPANRLDRIKPHEEYASYDPA